MHFIDMSEVLDTLEDDDDIVWKPNPFEVRPDGVRFDKPDESLAMIQVEGSPEFQEKLGFLCRKFLDVISTSVWRRPANVDQMEIVVDRAK